nr:MAG TPA: hypothetical protein [Caudoviricetes sp.]DAK45503.1 MAG TPA: hypothetical protein [Inoviridae sp.]
MQLSMQLNVFGCIKLIRLINKTYRKPKRKLIFFSMQPLYILSGCIYYSINQEQTVRKTV